MSVENASKIERLLREDKALQAKLRTAVESFSGEKADEQAFFEATLGKLAAEVGLPFTLEEGGAFVGRDAELSDAELEAVAGGGNASCSIIGWTNDGVEHECHNHSGYYCAYWGITFD